MTDEVTAVYIAGQFRSLPNLLPPLVRYSLNHFRPNMMKFLIVLALALCLDFALSDPLRLQVEVAAKPGTETQYPLERVKK